MATVDLTKRFDVRIILDKFAKESILGIKNTYFTKLIGNYKRNPLRATNKFGQSLTYSIGDNKLQIFTSVDYLESMVTGLSPTMAKRENVSTLYKKLIDWATAKPVQLKGSISISDFAWVAAKKIQREGTTIYNQFGKKGQESGLVTDNINEESIGLLMADLSLSIEEYLVKEFKASFA
jgi:hypothetical protein